ncbi:MAG TPA: hypothetical protein VH143_10270 [Kofleriaceae bacterium]|jgi:hypothetical protein|nr:hypothetical protein [Kofleriaceae bacterium]
MQTLSKFLAVITLGACAAQNSAAVHHGTGSGSGSDDSGDMDAGVGSGSGSDEGSGSGSGSAIVPPGTLYGSVLDERNDAIDFSSGEPVHTHTGAATDLSQGCPAVYKYGYLEDAADPMFGSQTNANPLEWHVTSQVGSLDDSATAYRVRLDDGTVALDWTSAQAPDDNGLYTVRLYRNGAPSVTPVGDHTGKMYLDMRFRDTLGNETVDTACWENHPMAAPLEIDAATHSDLFNTTLSAHSPISPAINTASLDGAAEEKVGMAVFSQEIYQHTAEPVTLHIDHSAITAIASMTSYTTSIAVTSTLIDQACATVGCNTFINVPKTASSSGPLAATWNMQVYDVASWTIVCHNPDGVSPASAIDGCVLPARTTSEPPHHYELVIAMSGAQSIDPDATGTLSIGEQSVVDTAGVTTSFTGALTNGATACPAHTLPNGTTECETKTHYDVVTALDDAMIAFNPFSQIYETAPDSNASLEAIGAYVPSTSLTLAGAVWSAGSAGF